jgi:dodecin
MRPTHAVHAQRSHQIRARRSDRRGGLANRKEPGMSEHVYKLVELVGSSTNGIEDAVQNAITKAGDSIRNMRWFQVVETRGYIQDGKIAYWQVTVKIGFTIED